MCIRDSGYTMVVMYLDKGMPADEQYLALENAGCTGFIVYAVEMYPEDTGVFRRLSRPCVFLDNPFPTLSVDTVTVDNRVGIYQGFEYLYEMGHRRIGYIKSKCQFICFEERFRAFRECMRRRDVYKRQGYKHGQYVDFDIDEALSMKKAIPAYQYEIAKQLAL